MHREEADRRRCPKKKTCESLMKLKFLSCNLISCDFQILDQLSTPKLFRKFFSGVKKGDTGGLTKEAYLSNLIVSLKQNVSGLKTANCIDPFHGCAIALLTETK